MCGIAGVITNHVNRFDLSDISLSLIDKIKHRGPDGTKIWTDSKNICLAHSRLSILDLSENGSQPIVSKSKRYVMVFNGEIYNYNELRRKYLKDLRFSGHSDSEVLLELISNIGLEKTLEEINGMYSIGLWDSNSEKLFLIRDRVGKKPLYYHINNNMISFSSEIKSFKNLPYIYNLTINDSAICDYLSLSYIPGKQTIYNEVHEVPSGSFLIINKYLTFTINKYWNPIIENGSEIFNSEQFESLFSQAVTCRLNADVPVGIFLSGGIDSGLITAIAAINSSSPVDTYTVCFSGENNESEQAREVSNRYNTNHHEIYLSHLNISDLIDNVSSFYDEPIGDPSVIPTYLVSREASKSCKVVLNGEGSDELFGGYRRYIAAKYIEQLNTILPKKLISLISGIVSYLPQTKNYRGIYSNFLRTIKPSAKEYIDSYISLTSDGLDGYEKKLFLKESMKIYSLINKEYIEDVGNNSRYLMRFMFTDFFTGMKDSLLNKIDMCTMVNSIEGRSPFLDVNVVEYALRLKRSELFGRQTKKHLRHFSKKYLPENIVSAAKKGFEPPYQNWIDNQLSDKIREICFNKNSIIHNYLDEKLIGGIYDNNIKLIDNHRRYKLLWIFLMLDSWSRSD